jgi:carbon storage regulator
MLVLTRRVGEEMVIAGNIRVAVVGVKGGKVRLGITAPSSVAVTRRELLENFTDAVTSGATSLPPLHSAAS